MFIPGGDGWSAWEPSPRAFRSYSWYFSRSPVRHLRFYLSLTRNANNPFLIHKLRLQNLSRQSHVNTANILRLQLPSTKPGVRTFELGK